MNGSNIILGDVRSIIAIRAWSYWDGAGRPAGRDLEFWARAKRDVEREYGWAEWEVDRLLAR